MKIYSEIGYGNDTFVSSEIEYDDGTEVRVKGFLVKSVTEVYFRLWVKKTVFIYSSREGFKTVFKSKNKFKLIIGFA